jgi:hypothetical protein
VGLGFSDEALVFVPEEDGVRLEPLGLVQLNGLRSPERLQERIEGSFQIPPIAVAELVVEEPLEVDDRARRRLLSPDISECW